MIAYTDKELNNHDIPELFRKKYDGKSNSLAKDSISNIFFSDVEFLSIVLMIIMLLEIPEENTRN